MTIFLTCLLAFSPSFILFQLHCPLHSLFLKHSQHALNMGPSHVLFFLVTLFPQISTGLTSSLPSGLLKITLLVSLLYFTYTNRKCYPSLLGPLYPFHPTFFSLRLISTISIIYLFVFIYCLLTSCPTKT